MCLQKVRQSLKELNQEIDRRKALCMKEHARRMDMVRVLLLEFPVFVFLYATLVLVLFVYQ